MSKNKLTVLLTLLMVLASFSSSFSSSDQPTSVKADKPGIFMEDQDEDISEAVSISDPLEPYNRLVYKFNDKFYFWVLKPAAKGYNKVAPQAVRKGIRNFFSNLTSPIRLVNCSLQGNFGGSAIELTRFVVNSTWGMAGFFDPAKSRLELVKQEEDFDQTLAKYGLGTGWFIMWPFWGPSSVRGTAGLAGDMALNPIFYLNFVDGLAYTTVNTFQTLNETSLKLGDYEDLKEAAIDPYASIRDAYFQNRKSKIEE